MDEGSPHFLTEADLIPDAAIASSGEDKFHHEQLARVVADAIQLECAKPRDPDRTSLNIAVYGPWGSGKTGFFHLIKETLATESPAVGVVRYDAWKYDDDSLQRHFLGQVAGQLDVEIPDLYTVKEHKRADPDFFTRSGARRLARWVAWWVIASTAVAVVLGLLVAFISASHRGLSVHHLYAFDWHVHAGWHRFWHDLRGEWRQFAKYLLGPAAALGVATGILRIFFEEALVSYRRDKPSEEEFEDLFATMLDHKRGESEEGIREETRFVFFVDELDRCGKEEVVATLHAIKNFLGRDDCVFVVAADRDVLEEALTKLPQSNPMNVEAPYYSSASEYLDKIFHLQLALPPLRTQRRTQFARELTQGRQAGVWAELERANQLDSVLFVLIPQHVQSPRRIKTLLAGFAVNARAAQARGLPWNLRALEIAKLTALQTEFPLFARDLPFEPRLPQWLLEAPDSAFELSPQQRGLLERHKLPRVDDETPDEEAEGDVDQSDLSSESAVEPQVGLSATDKILVGRRDEREPLIREQRWQLRRYLEARTRFDDPRRDLLFLESIGGFVGLTDPELAADIESDAPESPRRVLRQLEGRGETDIRAAIQLITALVPDYRGPERDNLIETALGAIQLLPGSLDPESARAVARSLMDDGTNLSQITVGELPLAVEIGITANEQRLVSRLLKHPPTLEDIDNVKQVAVFIHRLPRGGAQQVEQRIISLFASDPTVLFEPLAALPEQAADQLLRNVFRGTVATALGSEESTDDIASADGVLAAARVNGPSLEVTAFDLLLNVEKRDDALYSLLRERAEAILLSPAANERRASLALRGFIEGPPADWEFWLDAAALPPALPTASDNESRFSRDEGLDAVTAVFDQYRELTPEEQEGAAEVVTRLVEVSALTVDDLDDDELRASIKEAVGESRWASTRESAAAQLHLHRAVRSLQENLPEGIETILTEDLVGEATAPAAPAQPGLPPASSFAELIAPIAEIAPEMIVERVGVTIATTRPSSVDRTAGLLRIAASLVHRGLDPGAFDEWVDLSTDEIVDCVTEGSTASLEQWLKTEPDVASAIQVAVVLAERGSTVRAYVAWATRQSVAARTMLLEAMITARRDASSWIEKIRNFDDVALVKHLNKLLHETPKQPGRELLTKSLVAIGPTSPQALKSAADFLIALFQQGTKSDFWDAFNALPVLGGTIPHGKSQALHSAVTSTAKKHNLKVQRDAAENAGLRLNKRFYERSWVGRGKNLAKDDSSESPGRAGH